MAYRSDAPLEPVPYWTPHYSKHLKDGRLVHFETSTARDRYDAAIDKQGRVDGSDDQRLDARQKMIKRETTLKPLGQQFFSKDK